MTLALRKSNLASLDPVTPHKAPASSHHVLQLERFQPQNLQSVDVITAQDLSKAHDAGFLAGKQSGFSTQIDQLSNALLNAVQAQDEATERLEKELDNIRSESKELIKAAISKVSKTCGKEKLIELVCDHIASNLGNVRSDFVINCPSEVQGGILQACEQIGISTPRIQSADSVWLENGQEIIRIDLQAMTESLLALIDAHFQGISR